MNIWSAGSGTTSTPQSQRCRLLHNIARRTTQDGLCPSLAILLICTENCTQ